MYGWKRAARGTTYAFVRSISMVATRYRHWLRIFNCLRALPCFAKGWPAARKGLSGGIAIAVLVVHWCFAFASNKIPLPTPRSMEASASTPQAQERPFHNRSLRANDRFAPKAADHEHKHRQRLNAQSALKSAAGDRAARRVGWRRIPKDLSFLCL